MKTNIVVSHRGQLTLPTELRKKYGIHGGSVLVAEERNGEIVLKPASVVAVEFYSDEQVRSWVKDDAFVSASDREATKKKLKKSHVRNEDFH